MTRFIRILAVRNLAAQLLVLCGCLLALGCDDRNELQTEYNNNSLDWYQTSVNGLGVFKDLFAARGNETAVTSALQPRAKASADVIVWAPQDYAAPSADAVTWLENWLNAQPGRTLVYVHRDFDAAPAYWLKVGPTASPAQAGDVATRASASASRYASERAGLVNSPPPYGWFNVVVANNPRVITALAGDPAWTAGINQSKLEIELTSDIQPLATGRVVLSSAAGEPLVIREQRANGSQVLVLANGSFVLNYSLINPEHRKLAGKIVDATGKDHYVVFLAAGSAPSISESETPKNAIFDILKVEPINYVLFHLLAFTLFLIFARYPIFGIPKDDNPDDLSDFGKHIDAMGDLLASQGDERAAYARVQAYRRLVRGDHVSSRNLYAGPASSGGKTPTEGTGTGTSSSEAPSGTPASAQPTTLASSSASAQAKPFEMKLDDEPASNEPASDEPLGNPPGETP